MRKVLLSLMCGLMVGYGTGCIYQAPPPDEQGGDAVVGGEEAPVADGPGVEVITEEPDPAERVYVYDPGFPPGVYFYGGYYWYGGYRYPHDVFINRYVDVNLRNHRYVDAADNRRRGAAIERSHREEFARTGGRHAAPMHGGGPHDGGDHGHDR